MDQSSTYNEIPIEIDEQNVEDRCQLEIITSPIEECQTNTMTTEFLSLSELNSENNTLVVDDSDDEPLLIVPPILNNRRKCSCYCLEIFIGFVVVIFIIMVVISGVLFIKENIEPSPPTKGCNNPSKTGKSCSIDNLKTTVLVSLVYASYKQSTNYSSVYMAQSDTTIITFSFDKGGYWHFNSVSIRDMSNNRELIEDDGLGNCMINTYCVCDSNPSSIQSKKSNQYSNFTVCEINNFNSAVQLSQSVNTISGHGYNVSFWLQSQTSLNNHVTVYMSSS